MASGIPPNRAQIAATAAAFFPGGWFRSGDIGVRDADGFYFITGRIKELIIKGGENIAPREIDEVLLRHPAVLDAAAVGVPDRHYGQEIAACVVRREGASCSEDDLRAVYRYVKSLPVKGAAAPAYVPPGVAARGSIVRASLRSSVVTERATLASPREAMRDRMSMSRVTSADLVTMPTG